MSKTAFLFSGQGAQYSGMGKSLYETSPAAKRIFDMAEEIRPGTISQCFDGSAEELSITKNTQPCLYCVDLAAGRALEEAGLLADFAAGFSLGEIAALTFAGMLSEEEGFSFVCARAQAMQKAAEENPGSMAAVLKLSNAQVEELCKEFSKVYPVNYNCPGQLVVAGEKAELAEFCERVSQAGGKAVALAVSGGFHSPFMHSAAQSLKAVAEKILFSKPRIPVYANFTAKPYDAETAKELLISQVENPVRWQGTLEALSAEGAENFFECGAGKTLCGLTKKTLRGSVAYNVQDAESLAAAAQLR